jgi:3-oxoacyl-[acyl-carrier-protein] synthase II
MTVARPRHAAIVGYGVASPLGSSRAEFELGLATEGRTRACPVEFPILEHSQFFGCPVVGVDPFERLAAHEVRRMDRSHLLGLWAAEDALAGLSSVERDRCSVVVGIGYGAAAFAEEQFLALHSRGIRAVSPATIPTVMPNSVAAQLSMKFGFRGPAITVAAACAAGAMALGEALWLIRSGRADRVLAGGVDALHAPTVWSFFQRTEALSKKHDDPTRSSRPFDRDRDGFVLGEGAGFVVLDRIGTSDASIGYLMGYGSNSDAHHIVRPLAGGKGARDCMVLALHDAGLSPGEVGHVNAHGTSTPLNDVAEAAAIAAVFGGHELPVTATKGAMGHLIGAAGAVEAIASMICCNSGSVPPIANLDNVDPEVHIDVARETRAIRRLPAISNSFAFGGHNATLVLAPAGWL